MMATQLRDRLTGANGKVLALVDDALQRLSQRELVTTEEARACLRGIAAKVDDPVLAASAASVVEEATASYDDSLLVSGSHVVDTLLDLRLVLTG
jgi:hypothetical protein